jgi:hypothetical protein
MMPERVGDAPAREAARLATKFILSRIMLFAPTRKSAESFKARRSPGTRTGYVIWSNDDGTIATEIDARHPLFGDREHWYNTDQNHPERKGFIEKAARDAYDRAAEQFADSWAEGVCAQSKYLDLKR